MGKNTLKMNLRGFNELMTKLDKAGGSLKNTVTDALEQLGETVGEDTDEAMENKNLPAQGNYSTGQTRQAIIENPPVKWNGTVASVKVGFDYAHARAAGYLITGTPKMKPVSRLKTMYKGKKYPRQLQQDMIDIVNDDIERALGGKGR